MPTKLSHSGTDATKEQVGGEASIQHSSLDSPDGELHMAPFPVPVSESAFKNRNWMEHEEFMREILDVQIDPPNGDPDQENIFPKFEVGGVAQVIRRDGSVQRIRRCFVEAMARCREASVTATYKPTGEREYQNSTRLTTRALKYPFRVISDPSGAKGQQWLREVLTDRH